MSTPSFSNRFIGFIGLITIFVLLFFKAATPGLNWFIYSATAAITVFLLVPKTAIKDYIIPAVGLVISGLSVFIHSNALGIIATLLSFGYLGISLIIPKIDPFIGAITGIANYLMSPIGVLIRFFQKVGQKSGRFRGFFGSLIIPGILILFFGILYYKSSPSFTQLLDKISWDNVPQFIFTVILGVFSASILFYGFAPQSFNDMYQNLSNKSPKVSASLGGNDLSRSWQLGVWTLVVLLSIVVITDFQQRITGLTADDFTFASHLHQGVYASIFSIICAGVLSVITSNYLNSNHTKSIRVGNYVFIVLNVIFVLQNMVRNYDYVMQYSLTSKRLIIFIYLIMCLIGLAITAYTIYKNKSIGFLYKTNAFNIYIVVVMCTLFNWSKIITSYNVNNPYGSNKEVDFDYLFSLDRSNTPILNRHIDKMSKDELQRLEDRNRYNSTYYESDFREYILDKKRTAEQISTTNPFNN